VRGGGEEGGRFTHSSIRVSGFGAAEIDRSNRRKRGMCSPNADCGYSGRATRTKIPFVWGAEKPKLFPIPSAPRPVAPPCRRLTARGVSNTEFSSLRTRQSSHPPSPDKRWYRRNSRDFALICQVMLANFPLVCPWFIRDVDRYMRNQIFRWKIRPFAHGGSALASRRVCVPDITYTRNAGFTCVPEGLYLSQVVSAWRSYV